MSIANVIGPITEHEARAAMTEALTEFKSSVSHFERAWGIVLDALDRGAHVALGYRSESDLIAHEFDGYLNALDVANRRVVVRELSSRGASSRAIAGVTGTDHSTVSRDRSAIAGVADATPASVGTVHNDREVFRTEHLTDEPGRIVKLTGPGSVADPHVDRETGEVSDNYLSDDENGGEVTPFTEAIPVADDVEEAPGRGVEPSSSPAPSRPAVVGIDGKTYTPREPVKPKRRSLVDDARDAGQELRKAVERLERIAGDDRLDRNKEEVAAHLRHHLDRAIKVCQDLDRFINTQEESTQ